MKFKLTAPCFNCPFKRHTPLYLSNRRRREIAGYIGRDDLTFACHKTTSVGRRRPMEEQMCAGAIILHLNAGHPNWRLRMAEQLGLWSRDSMRGIELVYSSVEAMERGQE